MICISNYAGGVYNFIEKFTLMKKVICFMSAALIAVSVLSLFVAGGQERDDEDKIHIDLKIPTGGGHRSSASDIEGDLYPTSSRVVLYSNDLFTTAEVDIVNVTTGTVSTQDVLISSRFVALPLSGPGSYTIEILLADGTCYYGEFNL